MKLYIAESENNIKTFNSLDEFAKLYDFATKQVTSYFAERWQLTQNETNRLFNGMVTLDDIKPHTDIFSMIKNYIEESQRSDHDFLGNLIILKLEDTIVFSQIRETLRSE